MAEGTWVGLDVHARKVVAGVLDAGSGEVRSWRVPTLPVETVEWLRQFRAPVRVAYEAGPTGYGLARACAAAGIACTVAAPSKIPRAAGDRVKTDRRDAERLARLLRLGELVAVRVPEPHEEAARDLVRAREDARGDLMRARHRLSKLLLAARARLRRERVDAARTTPGFAGSGSPARPLAIAFDESYAAVLQAKTRRDALDQAIAELAAEPPFAEIVGRLVCLRGVSTLTALALDGRARRLDSASGRESLGPFLGLDAERELDRASGAARARSPRPATRHARRLLVEAAWHQRDRCARAPRSSSADRASPPPCAHRADRSARRLHDRWHALERARQAPHDRRGRRRARARRPLLGARDHVADQRRTARRGERTGATDARSDPRVQLRAAPHGDARL